MRTLDLKLGSEKINIPVPAGSETLEVSSPPIDIRHEDFISGLEESLDISPGARVGIIVSDKTRLCGYPLYLPWLTAYLESRGVEHEDITFYIAYGTHPPQSDSESLSAYGDTWLNYRFVHHNCDELEEMVSLGTTTSGTDVRVRKDIFEYDFLILFGAISHHYFAGYGGGRKLIFPGLAARNSIYQNHKLFIDFDKGILKPGCQSGQISGNPVAEDLAEIDGLMPEKTIISGILNTEGKVARLLINNDYESFLDSCKLYDNSYRYKRERLYDLVIASAGGYPKDINFIQAHKSMHNSASFVKDGGRLILLAECRDGIGNESFLSIFGGGLAEIAAGLSRNYSGNGGTAMSTLTKTSRIEVSMVTSLPEDACRKMGIRKIDPDDIGGIIEQTEGPVAVIRNASIIF